MKLEDQETDRGALELGNKYSVGVAEMDAQHRKWLGILNRLHEAMLAGKKQWLAKHILAQDTQHGGWLKQH